MRATVFHAPHDVRVEQVPDAAVQKSRDAVVRVLRACICGSDLWPYSGGTPKPAGSRIGHEFLGVVEAVGDELTVLFDSGIRTGADIVKALALGADAVLIGRPYVYGLALDGQRGCRTVMRQLVDELEEEVRKAGRRSHRTLSPSSLTRAR